MDPYKFLEVVKEYTEDINRDLENAKKINDLEKRWENYFFLFGVHKSNLERLEEIKPKDYYDGDWSYNLTNYKKRIRELEELRDETLKKTKEREKKLNGSKKNKTKETKKPFSKSVPNSKSSQVEDVEWCKGCYTEIKPRKFYYFHKSKNDSCKFCSTECYNDYYGEFCSRCANKFLNLHYPDKEKHPHVAYCSSCYEKNKTEEQEEDKDKLVQSCHFCNDKCASNSNLCEKIECLLKHDEEYARKHNLPFDKEEQRRERERERERESKIAPNNPNFALKSWI